MNVLETHKQHRISVCMEFMKPTDKFCIGHVFKINCRKLRDAAKHSKTLIQQPKQTYFTPPKLPKYNHDDGECSIAISTMCTRQLNIVNLTDMADPKYHNLGFLCKDHPVSITMKR